MLITLAEILYFIILTAVLGYIFTGLFAVRPKTTYHYMHPFNFNLQDFKFAILISAPAVILHELAHKFTAIVFGYEAFFHVFWPGLAIAVFLKLIHSPFLIIAPGYVSIPLITNPLQYRLIAFAGPVINLLLWLIASIILKYKKNLSRKKMIALYLTKKINMLLLIINMIPFGPLDGAKVLFGPPSL